ncbi:uncharacterized protein PG998_007966 [Apiospora kogelbergensis]|uniref:uncharacterized protein n=1 Tax=Apiospora kogelbergensis TaxID=1337665 RepID=UPI00312CD6F6
MWRLRWHSKAHDDLCIRVSEGFPNILASRTSSIPAESGVTDRMQCRSLVTLLSVAFVTGEAAATVTAASPPACKCGPEDRCWPSEDAWARLSRSLDDRLIKTGPVAESCYPGAALNRTECDYVNKMWSDQDFMTSNPIGRPYPYNITCAPVDYTSGAVPGSCNLGISPRYAVNATERRHVLAAIGFSKRNNIRLVVTSTGHDLNGRSDGYGSLEIWLRNYRNGINFQKSYTSVNGCEKSDWTGGAIHIDGAYQWRDVYKIAKANNVIVVGGGAVSPGAIGGWPSGGGHGPATRNYGLGADQILEAQVVLADGRVVTANHCENRSLFKAMRGGGPGYGIVLSTTVKVYPNVGVVTVQHLEISPSPQVASPDNKHLLDAVAFMLQAYPGLNEAGYAGYAYWVRNFPIPFVGNSTSGYKHGFWAISKTLEEAEAAFAPVKAKLKAAFSDTLSITERYASYGDYWSFFEAESGLYDPAGTTSLLTSRLIDHVVVSDAAQVRNTVEVISGAPDEYTYNTVLLVSGGQVFVDGTEPDSLSGINPAWRRSPFAVITARGLPDGASGEVRRKIQHDITSVKGAALKRLAPDTAGYMNEGDRNDPDHIQAFYGDQYPGHLAAKQEYDPEDLFYCPTCVGSENWIERPDAPLCRR